MTSLRSRQWLGAVPAGTYLGRVSEPPAYARIIRPIGRTSARNVLACHLIQRAVWSAYSTEGRQPPPVADRHSGLLCMATSARCPLPVTGWGLSVPSLIDRQRGVSLASR